MKIGIDLDGVVYDFVSALRDYLVEETGRSPSDFPDATTWGFFKEWGLTVEQYERAVRRGIRDRRVFWIGVPLPGAIDGLRALVEDGHHLTIVTAREIAGAEIAARHATESWLSAWEVPHHDLRISNSKTGLGLDLLLDDAPHHYEEAVAAGERCVLFSRPWNLGAHPEAERVWGWNEFRRLVAWR